jgi:hypothetical protein
MNSQETLNSKVTTNKLSFVLVTHMVYSDAWFDIYRILNRGEGTEHCPDRLDIKMNDQVLRA